MEFWASSEIYRDAHEASELVRKAVEPHLNAAFSACSLNMLNCLLRYVPIIMPEGLRECHAARSKLRKNERIYDCAPQLKYEIFVDGTFEQQLREFLDGFAGSGFQLARLKASPAQLEDFELLMASAYERILIERRDQTRH